MARRLNWARDRERKLVAATQQDAARTNAILMKLTVPIYATPPDQAAAIETAFAKIKGFTIRNAGIARFVKSIEQRWRDTQHLTPRQQDALFKIARQKPRPMPIAMLSDPTPNLRRPHAVRWVDATPEQKAQMVAKLMAARQKPLRD